MSSIMEVSNEKRQPLSNTFSPSSYCENICLTNHEQKKHLKDLSEKFPGQIKCFLVIGGHESTFACLLCKNTVFCCNLEQHLLSPQHLQNLAIKHTDPFRKFLRDKQCLLEIENQKFLDYFPASEVFICTLCNLSLIFTWDLWLEHFKSDFHKSRLPNSDCKEQLSAPKISSKCKKVFKNENKIVSLDSLQSSIPPDGKLSASDTQVSATKISSTRKKLKNKENKIVFSSSGSLPSRRFPRVKLNVCKKQGSAPEISSKGRGKNRKKKQKGLNGTNSKQLATNSVPLDFTPSECIKFMKSLNGKTVDPVLDTLNNINSVPFLRLKPISSEKKFSFSNPECKTQYEKLCHRLQHQMSCFSVKKGKRLLLNCLLCGSQWHCDNVEKHVSDPSHSSKQAELESSTSVFQKFFERKWLWGENEPAYQTGDGTPLDKTLFQKRCLLRKEDQFFLNYFPVSKKHVCSLCNLIIVISAKDKWVQHFQSDHHLSHLKNFKLVVLQSLEERGNKTLCCSARDNKHDDYSENGNCPLRSKLKAPDCLTVPPPSINSESQLNCETKSVESFSPAPLSIEAKLHQSSDLRKQFGDKINMDEKQDKSIEIPSFKCFNLDDQSADKANHNLLPRVKDFIKLAPRTEKLIAKEGKAPEHSPVSNTVLRSNIVTVATASVDAVLSKTLTLADLTVNPDDSLFNRIRTDASTKTDSKSSEANRTPSSNCLFATPPKWSSFDDLFTSKFAPHLTPAEIKIYETSLKVVDLNHLDLFIVNRTQPKIKEPHLLCKVCDKSIHVTQVSDHTESRKHRLNIFKPLLSEENRKYLAVSKKFNYTCRLCCTALVRNSSMTKHFQSDSHNLKLQSLSAFRICSTYTSDSESDNSEDSDAEDDLVKNEEPAPFNFYQNELYSEGESPSSNYRFFQFASYNHTRKFLKVVKKLGSQINLFSICSFRFVGHEHKSTVQLDCLLCKQTLANLKEASIHIFQRKHLLHLADDRSRSLIKPYLPTAGGEPWKFLRPDFGQKCFFCTLCELEVMNDLTAWIKHFQSESHLLEFKNLCSALSSLERCNLSEQTTADDCKITDSSVVSKVHNLPKDCMNAVKPLQVIKSTEMLTPLDGGSCERREKRERRNEEKRKRKEQKNEEMREQKDWRNREVKEQKERWNDEMRKPKEIRKKGGNEILQDLKASEMLTPLNLFQDSFDSAALKSLSSIYQRQFANLISEIDYQINYFSPDNKTPSKELTLICKLCDESVLAIKAKMHTQQQKHLLNLFSKCNNLFNSANASYISEEDWNYLDFNEDLQEYVCTLCNAELSSCKDSWAQHFLGDLHSLKSKESQVSNFANEFC